MSRSLTPDSSLENFRREAKRWLKALRAGDPKSRHRLLAVLAGAPTDPGLRDVQLALAREYGFPGWTALRHALDDLALERRSHSERVEMVLRAAMWQGDRVSAARILAKWPEIATANIYAAATTGNRAEIERRLATDPVVAARKGGPLAAGSRCSTSPMPASRTSRRDWKRRSSCLITAPIPMRAGSDPGASRHSRCSPA